MGVGVHVGGVRAWTYIWVHVWCVETRGEHWVFCSILSTLFPWNSACHSEPGARLMATGPHSLSSHSMSGQAFHMDAGVWNQVLTLLQLTFLPLIQLSSPKSYIFWWGNIHWESEKEKEKMNVIKALLKSFFFLFLSFICFFLPSCLPGSDKGEERDEGSLYMFSWEQCHR